MKNLLYVMTVLVCLSCCITNASTKEKEFCPLSTEDLSVSISYPSPICTSSLPVNVVMSGTGSYLGGTFSSTPGLMIDPATGQINPSVSMPGAYIVLYTLSPNPTLGQPGMTTTTFVAIIQTAVPSFDTIDPICYGSSAPTLLSISNNDIIGTWLPPTVSNTVSAPYTFTPNSDQCIVATTININVIPAFAAPVIATDNGSNTVYVDENTNTVVASLVLSCGIESGNYTYLWYEDGIIIPNVTASTYTVDTASANGEDRIFTVEATNIETGCSNLSAEFIVFQSSGVPLPRGEANQTFAPGATLEDVVVLGTNIQWYESATNKNATAVALPLDTPLVDGTTYYATQTINDIESIERLPVTVHLALGIEENKLVSLIFSPNPTKNSLTITTKQDVVMTSISIYNTLGQLVQVSTNPSDTIDVSSLKTGSYFIKIVSDKGSATGKFIKE